jgi:tetratricopeptide (TPR) repeat protein
MSQRLSRKELKRDRVGEVLSRAMVYLSGHLKLAGVVLAGLALVLMLGLAIDRVMGGRQDVASDALATAIETLNTPLTSDLPPGAESGSPTHATAEARREAALGQFEAVVEKYGRSGGARIARSYIAVLHHESGDGEQARSLWQSLAKGDDVLAAQAELNLLTLDRQEGRGAEAESRLLALLDSGNGVLPQDVVLYQLALTQEQLGKSEESLQSFRRLSEEHPTSVYAAEASNRLGS